MIIRYVAALLQFVVDMSGIHNNNQYICYYIKYSRIKMKEHMDKGGRAERKLKQSTLCHFYEYRLKKTNGAVNNCVMRQTTICEYYDEFTNIGKMDMFEFFSFGAYKNSKEWAKVFHLKNYK